MAENQNTEQQLQEQLAAEQAKTTQLTKERDQARQAQGKAEQELLDANKIIDDLNQAAETAANAGSAPVVKLGKDEYRVLIPHFRHEGRVYTAADVKSNGTLLKELVKLESGVVELVVAKAEA